MQKNKISLIAAVILAAFTFSNVALAAPIKTNKKAPVKKVRTIKLKKASKPSAAELKAAKRQAAMEKNYARYIKGLISKKNKKTKTKSKSKVKTTRTVKK